MPDFDPDSDDATDDDFEVDGAEIGVLNEDGSVTYTLAYPTETLTALTLRRPKGADLEAMDKGASVVGRDCILIARLSKTEIATIESDLDGLDLEALRAIVKRFLDKPPASAKGDLAIVFNADGSACVPLATAKMSEGAPIENITLRRMKASDMKAAAEFAGGPNGRSNMLIARIANVPQATIKSLDGYDHQRLNKQASDFLSKRPATGAKPSSS